MTTLNNVGATQRRVLIRPQHPRRDKADACEAGIAQSLMEKAVQLEAVPATESVDKLVVHVLWSK